MDALKAMIRHVPDFPKPGITFFDITTLLRDREGFARAVESLANPYQGQAVDYVVGIESRGFIFGGAVADRLRAGFVPVRKIGKLPARTLRVTYDLEYGSDSLEIHEDAIEQGQRVLIVDDLLNLTLQRQKNRGPGWQKNAIFRKAIYFIRLTSGLTRTTKYSSWRFNV